MKKLVAKYSGCKSTLGVRQAISLFYKGKLVRSFSISGNFLNKKRHFQMLQESVFDYITENDCIVTNMMDVIEVAA